MKIFFLSFLLLLSNFFAYSQIGGGHTYSAMLSSEGQVFTFGNNTNGELGSINPPNFTPVPQAVQGLPRIRSIDAGSGSHMLSLACDSTIYSWGLASCGQLGVSAFNASGTFASSTTPVHVEKGEQNLGTTFLSKVVSVCGGNEQSYAVLANGNVMAWGKNNYGQLGNGTTVNSNTPVYVMTSAGVRLTNVVAVDAGDEQCYALTANGSVWSWGNNINKGLGRTSTIGYDVYASPVLKEGTNTPLKNIFTIAAGDNHGLALDSSGHVWSWGGNWGYGQLGNSSNAPSFAGLVVDIGVTSTTGPFLSNVISITAGNSFSLAALADGRVVSWGSNNFYGLDICAASYQSSPSGQLGVGVGVPGCTDTPYYTSSPVVVLTSGGTPLQNIVSVHRGDAWAFAISSLGTVYNWGWNREGQLGNYSPNNSNYATNFTLPAATTIAYQCPKADLGPDLSVCPVFSETLIPGKAMSTYSYTWSYSTSKSGPYNIIAGPNTGMAAANYIATTLGYYKVEISDTRMTVGCQACKFSSDTIHISQNILPYTPNNSTYCGDSATFSVTGTGAYNWYDSYSGGTKRNTSTVNSIKVPLTQAHQVNVNTYELFVEDVANTSFTIGPIPSCTGSTTNGSSSPVMFQAYSNFTLDSVKFVQPAFVSPATYTVQIFSNNPTGGPYCSNCCGGAPCYIDGPSASPLMTSATISLPVVTVNTVRTIPINLNIAGASTGTKYWIVLTGYVQLFNCVPSPGFPFSDDATSPSIKIVKALYNNTTSSNYGVMYNWHISKGISNPCSRVPVRSVSSCTTGCSQKPSAVTINPMSSLSLCSNIPGDSVILNTTVSPATPTTGQYQYKWFKNGILINGATNSSYTAKISGGSANYSVKVNNSTNTDTACYRSSNVGVVVMSVPAAFAGPDQTIRYSTSTLYGNNPPSVNKTWSLQSGSAIIDQPSSYYTGITVDLGISIFRYTITVPGCPSNYDEVTVERVTCNNTPDSVTIILSDTSAMCSNSVTDSVIITTNVYPASPVSGTYLYTWYKDGKIINGATSSSYVVKPERLSFVYGVSVSSSSDNPIACTASAYCNVNMIDVPVADAGQDIHTTLSSTQLYGNLAYAGTGVWNLQSGSATIDNPNDQLSTLSSLGLGLSILRWTITVPGCQPTYDEVTVEKTCYNNLDSIAIVPSGSLFICSNSISNNVVLNTHVYNSNPLIGSYQYTWYKDGTIIDNATTSSYVVKAQEGSANYSVRTISSMDYELGCSVSTDTSVYILNVPSADAGPDQITSNSQVQLQGNSSPLGSGMWTLISGSATIDDPSNSASTLSAISTGVSVLRWTLTFSECGPNSDDVTIEKGDVPSAPVITGPNSTAYGQQITFTVPYYPSLNYSWQISSSGLIISGQDSNIVTVVFNDSGIPQEDSLSVTVINKFGGSHNSKIILGLTSGLSLNTTINAFTFSPNPFSEEGVLKNTLPYIGNYTVSITDLMGKEIFRSEYPYGASISIGKNLKNGVYLLNILSSQGKTTSKIIKLD